MAWPRQTCCVFHPLMDLSPFPNTRRRAGTALRVPRIKGIEVSPLRTVEEAHCTGRGALGGNRAH